MAGAVGLRFPYQRPKKRSLTRSRRFLGGAGNPLNEASAMTVLQP